MPRSDVDESCDLQAFQSQMMREPAAKIQYIFSVRISCNPMRIHAIPCDPMRSHAVFMWPHASYIRLPCSLRGPDSCVRARRARLPVSTALSRPRAAPYSRGSVLCGLCAVRRIAVWAHNNLYSIN